MGQQQQQQQFYFTQMVFPSLQIEEMSELVMRKKKNPAFSFFWRLLLSYPLSYQGILCHVKQLELSRLR